MDNLTECPVPPFWAIFEELVEQGVCDASEFSNKEIAETVSLLSTDGTMSTLQFDLSYMLSMVLDFLILMQSSLLSSPSNLLWLMTSVLSTLYKFILEPYITVYKLVGPGRLSYLAFETFSIFLFIAFCCLYRGSITGMSLTVRFLPREAAESITGVKLTVPKDEENRMLGENTRIMTISTGFIDKCKKVVGGLRASVKWTHAALALFFALIIQIPAVSANAQLVPGIVYQCSVSAAGVSLACYRYIEAAVIAMAQLMSEIFLSQYQKAVANLRNSTASFNEKFRQEIRGESHSTKEVGGEYEVVYDSEAAARARFRFFNKIARGILIFLFQAWFTYRLMPYLSHLMRQRYRPRPQQ
ncbi:hypothetical protein BOTCAL_0327g00150 [Botryotinia calthae]|uniref:Uncharacterized protein n=1 Tax=Botryotinia calthae TaxID=38488 RepID=A0A4Y8CTD4_9HELO|nr:hypothetical protein BOTCAL_0327g00150 [Botryotinia calthae]